MLIIIILRLFRYLIFLKTISFSLIWILKLVNLNIAEPIKTLYLEPRSQKLESLSPHILELKKIFAT